MDETLPGRQLADEDTLRIYEWRSRICRYLMVMGAGWLIVGGLMILLANKPLSEAPVMGRFVVLAFTMGLAISSVALALKLAIYRCPLCDKYLNSFTPQSEFCPSCGAMLRASKAK